MEQLFAIKYSYLIPLLPLLGAAIAGFLCTGARKHLAHWPIWIGVGASAVLSLSLLFSMLGLAQGEGSLYYVQHYYPWISAGNAQLGGAFHVGVSYLFDPLTAVMLCVVTGIGFLITVYAAGYMKGDDGYSRFFAYLGLFIFMMTNLVMGANLIMLYLGWEGVGLCSYLLIGYYYQKPSARDAAKKAFLVNRVGDFGFGLGIMLTFLAFGTVSYFGDNAGGSGFIQAASGGSLSAMQVTALQWIPFMLMVGAFGKSAQFPLYVWLPDAMEGPTPVSALIHAATMVTAGVYMIVRCGAVFVGNDAAMWTIAIVGAFTALFSATIAMRQFDLKKVFAYSTISQLGFMFVAAGVLAPVAGVFHLVTHAFFKALLFLCSGVVMHAMMGHLDMRKMSGLKAVLPKTRWLLLIGCLALAGFPFFSGFFSKDEIIASALERSRILGIVLLVTAFLTAYYTFRVYFRVFEGPLVMPDTPADGHGHPAADSHDHHAHDAVEAQSRSALPEHAAMKVPPAHHHHEPALMILPLVILAIGAIFAGYLNMHDRLGEFLGKSPSLEHASSVIQAALPDHPNESNAMAFAYGQKDMRDAHAREMAEWRHWQMMLISGIIAFAGIGVAYVLHLNRRELDGRIAAANPRVIKLLEGKYYVDELYNALIVTPLWRMGQAMFFFDKIVIDGAVWAVGFVPQAAGFVTKRSTQRGEMQGYALTMLLGVVVILWIVFATL